NVFLILDDNFLMQVGEVNFHNGNFQKSKVYLKSSLNSGKLSTSLKSYAEKLLHEIEDKEKR
ncbi:MAG: hypothetical protein ACM3X1_03155, partial [Ignavibacteriales bacterium]